MIPFHMSVEFDEISRGFSDGIISNSLFSDGIVRRDLFDDTSGGVIRSGNRTKKKNASSKFFFFKAFSA